MKCAVLYLKNKKSKIISSEKNKDADQKDVPGFDRLLGEEERSIQQEKQIILRSDAHANITNENSKDE